jgi:hypothetical protein
MQGEIIGKKLLSINEGIICVENNPEIQEILDSYGCTSEFMAKGKEMYIKVTDMVITQVEDYSNQYVATSEFKKFREKTYHNYIITLKMIRVAFTDQPEILQRFNAVGRRNRSLSGWLRDSKIMYTNILNSPETLEVMSQYKYTQERLNKEFQDVIEVERLHSIQLREKGMAQQATLDRDEAFDKLCKWYSKFRAIARIALYDRPQLLEALGIVKKN